MESLSRRAWRLRIRPTLTDPWTVLVCAGGGGIAWALGTPAPLSAVVSGGMLAAAGIAAVFRPAPVERAGAEPARLRAGTQQAQLVSALEGYLADLRRLRHSGLADTLTNSAIEALVAAEDAVGVAQRVARAVDGLDDALARAAQVGGPSGASPEVRAVMQRMQARREHLLQRLRSALAEVSEVYAKLLELSATAELPAPGLNGPGSVDEVNRSLDALRESFAQLDAEARGALPG
jgi:hypothetical protein